MQIGPNFFFYATNGFVRMWLDAGCGAGMTRALWGHDDAGTGLGEPNEEWCTTMQEHIKIWRGERESMCSQDLRGIPGLYYAFPAENQVTEFEKLSADLLKTTYGPQIDVIRVCRYACQVTRTIQDCSQSKRVFVGSWRAEDGTWHIKTRLAKSRAGTKGIQGGREAGKGAFASHLYLREWFSTIDSCDSTCKIIVNILSLLPGIPYDNGKTRGPPSALAGPSSCTSLRTEGASTGSTQGPASSSTRSTTTAPLSNSATHAAAGTPSSSSGRKTGHPSHRPNLPADGHPNLHAGSPKGLWNCAVPCVILCIWHHIS